MAFSDAEILRRARMYMPKPEQRRREAAYLRRHEKKRHVERVMFLREVTGIDDVEICLPYMERGIPDALERHLDKQQNWYGGIKEDDRFVGMIRTLYDAVAAQDQTRIREQQIGFEMIFPRYRSLPCADHYPERLSDQFLGPLSIRREEPQE